MGKLNDMQIKAWIKADERFEGKGDGGGLYLRYRVTDATPTWRFRYKFSGRPRIMLIGGYPSMSLAEARKAAEKLSAQVTLGQDVAGERQERIAAALAKAEQEGQALTVAMLAEEYFDRMIANRWKHPGIVRARIDKDIAPHLGKLKLEDVRPRHIDDMLQAIVKRGAPTIANDVLRWVRRMFDYAIKRQMMETNPAAAFDLSDAGGKELARDRALSRPEIAKLLAAMKAAKGFSPQNELTIKLLLVLCVRKMELCSAPWSEFDLANAVWCLPADRSKTGEAIDIPLPPIAVEWLTELKRLACSSRWVLPARKMQTRMVPHIHEGTLGTALGKVKPLMQDVEPFTVHDLRRTARTQLSALGVDPIVAERCLNHKIPGIQGIYDRHCYFEERRDALNKLAAMVCALEAGESFNVVPLKAARI